MRTKRLIAKTWILSLAVLPGSFRVGSAASPPGLLNYQGVLRDASDDPQDGDFDMVFRFYDADGGAACVGGTLLLTDSHLAVGTGAVAVDGGLFSVQLGGGSITPGAASTTAEVFRDNAAVYLQVQVASEVLCPRMRVVAAGYALNADHLDGRTSADFLDTSATPQAKAGNLAVSDLTANGNDLFFGGGARIQNTSGLDLELFPDDADSSGVLRLSGGNSLDDGSIQILGGGPILFRATSHRFHNPSFLETAQLDGSGNLQIDGDLTVSGNDVAFGAGPQISGTSSVFQVTAGDSNSDDIFLVAGNSLEDGSLEILGNQLFRMRSGSGLFDFINGDTVQQIAQLDGSGNLQIDGNLQASWVGQTNGGFGLKVDFDGPDSAQFIDFFEDGANTGESLYWDDSTDEFRFTDDLRVLGNLVATGAKPFVQNHPDRADLSVVYAALEGDEVGTYTRGTARLDGSEASVLLGETFAWVTNPDIGLTAQITPRGPGQLYVESLTTNELVVRAAEGSPEDMTFDYVVFGLRIGYERFPTVQERLLEAPLPAALGEDDAVYPELKAYSALERFLHMEAEVYGRESVDPSAAEALRESIGEYETSGTTPSWARPERASEGNSEVGDQDSSTSLRDVSGGLRQDPAAQPDHLPGLPTRKEAPARRPDYGQAALSQGKLTALVGVAEFVEAGDVLVADGEYSGYLRKARRGADTAVVGIVSGESDVAFELFAPELPRPEPTLGYVPVAFSGIVQCKVDAGYGPVRIGDLLTTSPTAGHAMRAMEALPGTILGKALEPLEVGTGLIKVLVMPR